MQDKTDVRVNNYTEVKNFFFYYVKNKNNQSKKVIREWWKHILLISFILILVLCFSKLNFSINTDGVSLFLNNLKKIFQFSNTSDFYQNGIKVNLWFLSFKFLWKTFSITLAATVFGFIISILTSYVSCYQFNKFYTFVTKALILLLRSFPELVFIYIFANSKLFQKDFALFLVYVWFTWLWVHKYMIETLENIDLRSYRKSIFLGKSKIKSFIQEIIPRISNRYFALLLYSFELNLRWTTILSSLGLFGIGSLINFANDQLLFEQLSIPLFVLLSLLVLLDLTFYSLNKYVLKTKSKEIKNKDYKEIMKTSFNWKKILKIIILLSLIIFSIIQLSLLDFRITKYPHLNNFWHSFWKPEWINVNKAISSLFLNSIPFAILICFFSFVFSLFILPLTTDKLFSKPQVIFFKISNSFFRLLPSIIIFFFIYPLFNSSFTLIIIVLSISQTFKIDKQLNEIINDIDTKIIEILRIKGHTKLFIYFKYILPYIKKDYISLMLFNFEGQIRNSITYSFLSTELYIGNILTLKLSEKNFNLSQAMSFVWIVAIFIFSVNIFIEILKQIYVTKNGFLFDMLIFFKSIKKAVRLR